MLCDLWYIYDAVWDKLYIMMMYEAIYNDVWWCMIYDVCDVWWCMLLYLCPGDVAAIRLRQGFALRIRYDVCYLRIHVVTHWTEPTQYREHLLVLLVGMYMRADIVFHHMQSAGSSDQLEGAGLHQEPLRGLRYIAFQQHHQHCWDGTKSL